MDTLGRHAPTAAVEVSARITAQPHTDGTRIRELLNMVGQEPIEAVDFSLA